jgi:hypothetical protein
MLLTVVARPLWLTRSALVVGKEWQEQRELFIDYYFEGSSQFVVVGGGGHSINRYSTLVVCLSGWKT